MFAVRHGGFGRPRVMTQRVSSGITPTLTLIGGSPVDASAVAAAAVKELTGALHFSLGSTAPKC